ncbi:hypothetical protein DO021_19685 [Desulfobacter hydrogenophilus]|uniref:Baseplate J/gp47 family protein n=1 Tax=Desulfobacter hydrogenophilus TaxID=2291 RepID=A0A328F719_9BACT|nr:baseplate J/gp47 family protein [Desulfobacter hydrogenophilus]NDY73991.1 baseplate J/gp47 family protein [Desulfobacter hydrogenophilus]QBH14336.1 baseplate J/gp47 family protein [Desulfobacter hydrogenophilus]RAM00338.1 hypothetical protein DO021_19685 [Desulfobacter hydrogenophilus]
MSVPIDKTLDEVRTDLFSRISDAQSNGYLPQLLNLNKGVVRGLIEIWAWGLWQMYQFMVVVFKQLFPTLATGTWLDLHCSQVGVTRQVATRAVGMVSFSRLEAAGNVNIPMGTVVRTKPDGAGTMQRFLTVTAVILPEGALSVLSEVKAQDYGREANVTAGMISEIITPVAGIDSVTNAVDWLATEAVDNETDDALRQRYILAWKNINGSTKYAYESWARSVTGVVSARIMDRHPRGMGTVDVIIRGSAGVPSADLIAQVDAVVQASRPINDDVLVRGPVPVPVDVIAELVLASGTPSLILAEAESRVRAMFANPPVLDDVTPVYVGDDLTLDRFVLVMMAVSGVKEIIFADPVETVVVPADGLAVLAGVTLSYSFASEA